MDLCEECYEKVNCLIYPQKNIFPAFLDGDCLFCDATGVVIFSIPSQDFMVDCLLRSFLDSLKKVKDD